MAKVRKFTIQLDNSSVLVSVICYVEISTSGSVQFNTEPNDQITIEDQRHAENLVNWKWDWVDV